MRNHPIFIASLASSAALLLCSCETYVTPANEGNLTPVNLNTKAAYTGKPAITFPASIALVRVQGNSANGGGANGYNVVTTHELETEQDFNTISKMPGIAGVVSMNNLLLPKSGASNVDLREAAAKLHANAILVYTVNSDTHGNDMAPPLTLFTLGLAPNQTHKATSSASAILMDTKTGYIYGALEEKAERASMSSSWGSEDVRDATRRGAERAAFGKLVADFGPFWNDVHSRYAH